MVEKKYQTKADIWGMGCVIAELDACSKPYIEAGVDRKDRQLFKAANSCFPLSPKPDVEIGTVSSKDLLIVILKTLGQQGEQDLSFVTDEEAVSYI